MIQIFDICIRKRMKDFKRTIFVLYLIITKVGILLALHKINQLDFSPESKLPDCTKILISMDSFQNPLFLSEFVEYSFSQEFSPRILLNDGLQTNSLNSSVSNSQSQSPTSIKVSEIVLRNRWRNIKQPFNFCILIHYQDLNLVSDSLILYGPNVTKYSSIFVFMSENSFAHQAGSFRFQRDILFRRMYPLLLLITYSEEEIFKFQVICPLCQNALEPPGFYLDLSNNKKDPYSLNWTEIMEIDSQYNSNGHGSLAWLCRIGFRGNILDTEYHRKVESGAWRKFDELAQKDGVFLGILINLFNFTFERESWIPGVEEGNYSGIYLSSGGDLPTFHIYGRQLVYTHNLAEFFLYCRKTPIIPATGWDFFASPFDIEIWIGILITMGLYSIVHKLDWSKGLDIFWSVLGLSPSSDWRKSQFLSSLLVILIILNTGYLCVLTSKVIIPNQELDIENPYDLFKQGYRFVTKNDESLRQNKINYYRSYMRKFNINETEIVVSVDECDETHFPKCISHWAGLATGLLYLNEKSEQMLKIPAKNRSKCHGVKTLFREYWVTFYFQGPLAPQMYQVHQSLVASGVDIFWEKLHKVGSIYAAYRKADHYLNGDPPKLGFDTPILVVFKAYGVLIGICLLGFFFECIYYMVSKGIAFVCKFVWL